MRRSYLYAAWRDALPGELSTGVSLHSHTSRSRESMSFIPRYVEGVPYLGERVRKLEAAYAREHGMPFDYRRVWWNPPLEPKAAYEIERSQIETVLQREAMVSISDHDNIDAGFALELFPEVKQAPISTEWTVHTGPSFLHVGVHNLQPGRARMLMDAMAEVTAKPSEEGTEEVLDELVRDPATLVVLNHPWWDEDRIGEERHRAMLLGFLRRYRPYLHALELNGLRHWEENQRVLRLAEDWAMPVVAGGDRHGCEPNAVLNLTRARSFSEFVAEVRDGAPTHNVYMPQYREPLSVRVMEVMSDVLRTYEEFSEERRKWSDRVFYETPDGTVKRLSEVWAGNGPCVIGQYVGLVQLFRWRGMRRCLRWMLGEARPMLFES